jgi:tagaturonate reductase
MIDIANEKSDFDGSVAIAKPIPFGSIESFREQNDLYTVVLRGKENGEVINSSRIITSISQTLDCDINYDEYMALALEGDLRFIVSNTTEAGIVFDENDNFDGLPSTYPGKLTKFLYERYTIFNGSKKFGFIILPVELIEDNGKKLRECVLVLAEVWGLPEGFIKWVKECNYFCSTLVDRIVTGYPRGYADKVCEELGYEDKLVDIGEPFALWVIESEIDISAELPLDKIGLPVIFTDNHKPYKERKVRVLNGAHTASVLAGYLYGLDIVRDCMSDELMGKFIRNVVNDEIVPQVNLPLEEVKEFANSVFERFENPFIDHALLSISLNSVSKWKARVLPSFKDYYKNIGEIPKLITFSFAALLAFYSSENLKEDGLYAKRLNGDEYVIHDDRAVLEFFAENTGKCDFVEKACQNANFWGEDLSNYTDFAEKVAYWYERIMSNTKDALEEVLA